MRWLKNNIGIVLIIVGIVSFVFINNIFPIEEIKDSEGIIATEVNTNSNEIQVEIKGEVQLPGIYTCDRNDRIVDLINLAGGLTNYASIDHINRSQKLEDEMEIVIPRVAHKPSETPIIHRYINVEVKGEVISPGLYKLKENAIINDLILAAGGVSDKANLSMINLAEKLNEGDSILIGSYNDSNIYVEIKGQVKYPGVYFMQENDLVIDLINEAGGLLDDAKTNNINLVKKLNNHEVIIVENKLPMNESLAIDIKGAIKHPGVYYFSEGVRLIDAINMAGGLKENADYEKINLSKLLSDEEVIFIPEIVSETMITIDLKGQVKYPGVYFLKEGSRVVDLIALAGGFRPEADTENLNFSEILMDESLIVVDKISIITDKIFVEIKGEVSFPGIYALHQGQRLIDLIQRAGGFTSYADKDEVNRTRILKDEEIISIPSIQDEKIYFLITGEVFNPGTYYVNRGIDIIDLIYKAGGLTINADIQAIDFNLVFVSPGSINIPSINDDPSLPHMPVDKININTAGLEQLQSLSGIGIILAERIIEYRDNIGHFENIEDVMKVSGIKEYIYEKIKDDITV
ncbi:SLBB domain-containing protein [Mycoplasmatota bacterium]|nr:SLBB domain-containing protein [Mycoplasmatota bacterium]